MSEYGPRAGRATTSAHDEVAAREEESAPAAGGARASERISRDVPVREPIRLGQFLKLADVVEAGADVKELLADGEVTVNGEPEDRRGRQLRPGDVVEVGGTRLRVTAR